MLCRVQVKSNSTGDLSGLPSPQEAADKLKGKVDEVGRNVQGAGSNNPLSGNVPSPQEVRACTAVAFWYTIKFYRHLKACLEVSMSGRCALRNVNMYATMCNPETSCCNAGRRQAEGQSQRGRPQGAERRGQHLSAA